MASTLRVCSVFLWVTFAAGILSGCNDGSGGANGASASGEVTQAASGVADLSWTVPAAPAGASAELAGYRIYYGTSSTDLTHIVEVSNPTATSFVIDNLTAGTWYFAIKSYDTNDVESEPSAVLPVQI